MASNLLVGHFYPQIHETENLFLFVWLTKNEYLVIKIFFFESPVLKLESELKTNYK